MDYKDTLKLPQTSFPMKANLPAREPEISQIWKDLSLNTLPRPEDAGKPLFQLHDGPPYANGNIHVGHALNKILKDIVLKAKALEGYSVPYIPGWDCHGQPVEHAVVSKLGKKVEILSASKIRDLCKEYALQFVKLQSEQFQRLGILGDWENPYLTLNPVYEAEILRLSAKLVPYIYRSLKPVQWCRTCQTALAEAEVEYEDKSSPSIYVAFSVTDRNAFWDALEDKLVEFMPEKMSVIIWTTTPWTLPANLAISFNPQADYVLLELEGFGAVLIAEAMKEYVENDAKVKFGAILARTKGFSLAGLNAQHPFLDCNSRFLLGDHVTMDQGSGCVHTAPGHGSDDYIIGLKHGLPAYSPVDHEGRFTSDFPLMAGRTVEEANPEIVNLLAEKGALVHTAKVTHSYPHCWRCKQPILFRATPQWFISLEKNDLRQRLLDEIQRVKWIPAVGIERISGMVQRRVEWCISRQRNWGVPIPALYCNSCDEPLLDAGLIEKAADLVSRRGVAIWFAESDEEKQKFMPESKELDDAILSMKCSKCGSQSFRREKDIFDVWLESGASHQSVVRTRPELQYPVDLYLEGSDQHRGWFQSSLTTAVGAGLGAPFKSVLTHGFVVDGEGRKMSKSLGNVIAPKEVIDKYGADVLRLWVASEDFRGDVRVSDEILKRLSESYRKIRNTFRFMLGNLNDYTQADWIPPQDRNEIDRYILLRLADLAQQCRLNYREYEFHRIFQAVNSFCILDLSSFYLDIIKDRLYTWGINSTGRRAAQSTLAEIVVLLTQLVSPVLAFTGEEIWQELRKLGLVDAPSVNLAAYTSLPQTDDNGVTERWGRLIALRGEVCRALEAKRKDGVIGHSLDSKVILHSADSAWNDLLKQYVATPLGDELASLFISSQVEVLDGPPSGSDVVNGDELKELYILATRADGSKCPRCWKYTVEFGKSEQYSDVCPCCVDALTQ